MAIAPKLIVRLEVEEDSLAAEVADCPRCGPNLATHVTAKLIGRYGLNRCMDFGTFDGTSCDYCGWSNLPADQPRPSIVTDPS